MSGKYALIIGNTDYTDPGLSQLTAPGKDAEDFADVLKSQDYGEFDQVTTLINTDATVAREAIEEFFHQKTKDDLLVLYFSGHGVKDEIGRLYLAVKNTNRSKLRSTGIEADFVRDTMMHSRSKRQVLILDCCNSGAFAQGTKGTIGASMGAASAFDAGYGQVIITASDATQFAWEGDKVIGETDNSLFTHYLVEGLKGEADLNGDGRITVDELYDYAYEQVRAATPNQTPSKFSNKQQGEIILRQGMSIKDVPAVPIPNDLLDSMESPYSYVREAAVQQLIKLLNGRNLGLARSASKALEHIAENDDSRNISQMASQALNALRQANHAAQQNKKEGQDAIVIAEKEHEATEVSNRLAAQKVEDERLARQKVDGERKAIKEAENKSKLAVHSKSISSMMPQLQRRPISRNLIIGIGAGVVLCIGGFGLVYKVISTLGTSATETPLISASATKAMPTNTPVMTSTPESISTPDLSATKQARETASIVESTDVLESQANQWKLERSDSFDSSKNAYGWFLGSGGSDNEEAKIANGKYIWSFDPIQDIFFLAFSNVDSLNDFYLTMSVYETNNCSSCKYGMFFRYNANGDFYYFGISPKQKKYYFYLYKDEQIYLIDPTASTVINSSQSNKLTLTAQGSHFVISINDHFVTELTDDTIANGSIGLVVELDAHDKGAFEFDDIVLRVP